MKPARSPFEYEYASVALDQSVNPRMGTRTSASSVRMTHLRRKKGLEVEESVTPQSWLLRDRLSKFSSAVLGAAEQRRERLPRADHVLLGHRERLGDVGVGLGADAREPFRDLADELGRRSEELR